MSSSNSEKKSPSPTIEVANIVPGDHAGNLFCHIIDAGRYIFEEQRSMFRSQAGIYMVYLESGSGTFSIRGKQTDVKAGDLLLFRACEKHMCNLKGNLIWCHFDGPQARKLYRYLASEMGCVYCLTSNSPIPLTIYSVINDAKGDNPQDGKLSLAIYAALVMLYDRSMHVWPAEGGRDDDDPIRKAALYISDHCSEHIVIHDIAKKFSVDYAYLCRAFKKRLKRTPRKYLQEAKIERAKMLLTTTDKSVNEVALEVGYSSSTQFIKVFRKANGITPGEFQKVSQDMSSGKC